MNILISFQCGKYTIIPIKNASSAPALRFLVAKSQQGMPNGYVIGAIPNGGPKVPKDGELGAFTKNCGPRVRQKRAGHHGLLYPTPRRGLHLTRRHNQYPALKKKKWPHGEATSLAAKLSTSRRNRKIIKVSNCCWILSRIWRQLEPFI